MVARFFFPSPTQRCFSGTNRPKNFRATIYFASDLESWWLHHRCPRIYQQAANARKMPRMRHVQIRKNSLVSQLQNSGALQNRPFAPFCDSASSPILSEMVSSTEHGRHVPPSQTVTKSSIFPGAGVLQLPLVYEFDFAAFEFVVAAHDF